ncbi:helix-turn-helix domain-containing protein [Gordonia neofelifaecis]|nr:helix-turn-helix domain-containing protein [Gordonia neofelifaecis]
MDSSPSDRGVLRPELLPEFSRLPATGSAADLVRWFWISRWDLPLGRQSTQDVIAFGALNLVVQHDETVISGATTRISHRTLIGTGWAVGALLQPAASVGLPVQPLDLVDRVESVDGAEWSGLHSAVSDEMSRRPPDLAAATAAISAWLIDRVTPTDEALLVNRAVTSMETDPSLVRVDQTARRFNVSERTLQRLTSKYVGVSPASLIRRRRLQEAAHRVRTRPDASLAQIAADLGYTDHAHMTRDFASVLGFSPSAYRSDS